MSADVGDWTTETIQAIGWPLLDRLKEASKDEVPDEIVMFASTRSWRFEMKVVFTPVEEMAEEELNELFGIAP
jgi:hypothetical protein